jgi:hypothetical protein
MGQVELLFLQILLFFFYFELRRENRKGFGKYLKEDLKNNFKF